MLLEWIVGFVFGVIDAVLDLLPAWEPEPITAEGTIQGGLVAAVIPWGHLLAAIGTLLAWSLVVHLYRLVLWVLSMVYVSGDSA